MTSKSNALTIRNMSPADLDLALNWAAAEAWNPGLHDAACLYAADPKGFFIGEIKGEPVGCIATVAYDQSFGWLGMYIVRPEFRGLGHGITIWNAGMAYLGKRTIGLDGVENQQANYAKSGFHMTHRDIRFTGVAKGNIDATVVYLATLPFEQVLAYDRGIFPASRPQFLQCWTGRSASAALGIVRDGHLAGYGVLRICHNGYRIGPLYGDDDTIAEDLFAALAMRAGGSPLMMDVPEANPAAIALVKRHGMKEVFATARMYTGTLSKEPAERIFGITSMEVG